MNPLIWKRRLGFFFRNKTVNQRDIILIYHSVAGGPVSLPLRQFREQMTWLKENTHVVPLNDLLNIPNAGRLRVVLSFDDGYRTLYDIVHPLISAYNFPAIVYLNTGMVGMEKHMPSHPTLGHYPNEEFLNWQEVTQLVGQGWNVGGHGVDHVDLTQTSLTETKRQLLDCKNQIEARLDISCAHFAYTWGRYNMKVRREVAAAGFKTAVAAVHEPVIKHSDRFALPRIDIRTDYELKDFIDVVNGRWDFLGIKHRLTRLYV